jgi:hypothetical protein
MGFAQILVLWIVPAVIVLLACMAYFSGGEA